MDLIRIYRCLSDETRLRILHLLTHKSLCVCHLQNILQLPQVAISKHLACLRQHGMAQATRRGQWMIYTLPENLPLELNTQLKSLRECVSGHKKFQDDVRRLRKISHAVQDVMRSANGKRKRKPRIPVKTHTAVHRMEIDKTEEIFPDHLK